MDQHDAQSTCDTSLTMDETMATLKIAVDPSMANLPESSVLDLADGPPAENLPEPPEEPLQSDCCGTGCSPCVFDIYQEDLERWKELARLTPEEKAARLQNPTTKMEVGAVKAALSRHAYRTFDVVKIKQVSSDSFVYTLRLPEGCVLGTGLGQHAVLRVYSGKDSELTRQYTPISEVDRTGSFDVLIKLYQDGRMSGYMKEWKIGSKVDWRGPFGSFSYTPNQFKYIGMLACGTGIAPMVNIARAVVHNDEEDTTIHCIFACRTQHDLLLKEQLDHFKSYWNFTITYALSKTTAESVASNPGEVRYGDKVFYGRMNRELVENEMSSFLLNDRQSMMLICGTKSFSKDMINFLMKMGCPKETYFKF